MYICNLKQWLVKQKSFYEDKFLTLPCIYIIKEIKFFGTLNVVQYKIVTLISLGRVVI